MTVYSKKQFLLSEIADSYVKQIKNQSINSTINITSTINVDCTSDIPPCRVEDRLDNGKCPNYCQLCLETGFTRDDISGENRQKNQKLITDYKKTVCQGNCVCSLSNIDMNNTVFFNSFTKIDSGSINKDQILNDIKDSYEKKYDIITNDEFKKNISDIITKITQKIVQNVNQVISSQQEITIVGTGSSIKNVTMTIMIDAILKAMMSACSDDNSDCILENINSIVEEEIKKVKENIDNSFRATFLQIWGKVKIYFLILMIFIILLLLLFFTMLINRAIKSK